MAAREKRKDCEKGDQLRGVGRGTGGGCGGYPKGLRSSKEKERET